ncbi:hypothetical protein V5O48_008560 [Marasmius crinis-equi]|uniref:Uncharacterized protein n=1 Tax=Marasmius crinis-equi TaxID=585013 RepID=A0ABR3FDI2_9AGAR
MLRRSKNVPLHIQFQLCSSSRVGQFIRHDAALRHVLKEDIDRVASLTVKISSDKRTRFLSKHAISPAPRLRIIALTCEHHIQLPPEFLGGDTPALRELTVRRASFMKWPPPLFRNVAILRLLDQSTSSSRSSTEFVAALGGMLALEVLEMEDMAVLGPRRSDGQPTLPESIHLSCLRQLTLKSTKLRDCASVLECISFPDSTRVEITCRHDVSNTVPEESKRISARLAQIYDQSGAVFQYLVLRKVQHVSYISASPFNSRFSRPPGCLVVRLIQLQPDFNTHIAVLRHCLDPLSAVFEGLRTLETKVDNLLGVVDIVRRFGRLPCLDTIYIDGMNPHDMLSALVYGLHPIPISSHRSLEGEGVACGCVVPFPRIRTLVLDEVDFEDSAVLVDILSLQFRQRRIHGVGITTLALRKCIEVTRRTVSELKREGVDVDWDGAALYRESPTIGLATRLWERMNDSEL